MSNRRIVDLYVNVQTSLEVDSDGRSVSSALRLFRGDQMLLRIHLVDDDNAAYALDANLTFLLGLDTVFTPAHADLATATNASFNVAGDWADADPAAGKLAVRMALNTTELGTDLGSSEYKDGYLVLWATPPGSDAMMVFHIAVKVMNVAVEPAGTTPTGEETYLTAESLGAIIEQFTEGGVTKVRIKDSAGRTVAVFGE